MAAAQNARLVHLASRLEGIESRLNKAENPGAAQLDQLRQGFRGLEERIADAETTLGLSRRHAHHATSPAAGVAASLSRIHRRMCCSGTRWHPGTSVLLNGLSRIAQAPQPPAQPTAAGHRRESAAQPPRGSIQGGAREQPPAGAGGSTARQSAAINSVLGPRPAWQDTHPGATQRRLAAELSAKGVQPHSFARVAPDYYDWKLEERRAALGAPSVFCLCKSMVMVNTKVTGDMQRHYLVIVQYAASIHAEKLKRFLHKTANRNAQVGISKFNMRLAPQEVSVELTGFQHNSVSPIGLATALPIVLSHRIAELPENTLWLGAGEPDLKLCMPVDRFIAAYQPLVVDCTDDKRTMAS